MDPVHDKVVHGPGPYFDGPGPWTRSTEGVHGPGVHVLYFPNSNAATINTNLMLDFEQKIQHCYHNQFFVTKDMGKNNFHRSCLERINLSWFVTTLSSAKTKHLPGILICRHFEAVCFYVAHSFSHGNYASDLDHAQSFCRCVIFYWFVLSMRMQVILDSSFARPGSAPIPSIRRLSPQYDRQSKFWCPNETI